MRSRSPERASLVITHYQRLLDYIVPDRVHVLSDGRVARSGGPELALELEADGLCRIRRQGRYRRMAQQMDLPVQQFRTKAEQAYLDMFEAAGKALPGARDPFVSGLRAKAIETYGRLGLPHRRIEAWKYTDLRARLTDVNPLLKAEGIAVSEADLARALGGEIAALPAYRLVVVEGDLRADLSDIAGLKAAGVEVVSLGQALEKPPSWLKAALAQVNPREDDAVVALNTALMTGGAALRIGAGMTLDKPIHLIQLDGKGEPASTVTRNVVIAEPGSSATLIESFASLGMRGLQRNAVTEIRVGDKAALRHVKLRAGRRGCAASFDLRWSSLPPTRATTPSSSRPALRSARSQVYLAFTGEGSAADISGAFLMRGRQHCDTTLLVEHRVPHCTSRELFKGVLDNEARGVFQGKIIVSPGAQKTDGKQMAGALLLSEVAEFDSKPELEIFADDVVCGHGSTSGQIDEELLFYLEARGIPEAQARAGAQGRGARVPGRQRGGGARGRGRNRADQGLRERNRKRIPAAAAGAGVPAGRRRGEGPRHARPTAGDQAALLGGVAGGGPSVRGSATELGFPVILASQGGQGRA